MLELFNSKERDEDNWITLLQEADSRFRLIGIKQPPSSNLSFIEVVWKGTEASIEASAFEGCLPENSESALRDGVSKP